MLQISLTFEECSLNTRPIDSWDASLVSWIRRISVASSLSPELRLSCTRLNERLHHQHVGFVIIWLQAFKSHERLTMPRWCCAFLVSRTYAVCTNCRYRRTERHAFIVTLTTKTYLSTCGKREHYRFTELTAKTVSIIRFCHIRIGGERSLNGCRPLNGILPFDRCLRAYFIAFVFAQNVRPASGTPLLNTFLKTK